MKAAWYEKQGEAQEVLQVGDLPEPSLGKGEVRVRVHASGINPSDTKNRSGWEGLPLRFPQVIPHQDGAGVIEAVGEGVPSARMGERVWIYEAQLGRPFGTAAEFVVLPSEQAVRLPDSTNFVVGACLGVPAMTAHRCVFADGPVTGQTILVSGGAGAVGHYAIQLAKWGGARVITTVSSEQKAEVAHAAGADQVINYKSEDVAARIKEITKGEGVDRIVEVAFASNLAVDIAVLKRNGAIATYSSDSDNQPQLPFLPLLTKNITVHFVLVYVMSNSAHQSAISDITTCLETGTLHHLVAQRFPLAEVAAAHQGVESGHMIGNVVIEIN